MNVTDLSKRVDAGLWKRVEALRRVKGTRPVTMEEALYVLTHDLPSASPAEFNGATSVTYGQARRVIDRRVKSGLVKHERVWMRLDGRRKKISVLTWPTQQFGA